MRRDHLTSQRKEETEAAYMMRDSADAVEREIVKTKDEQCFASKRRIYKIGYLRAMHVYCLLWDDPN